MRRAGCCGGCRIGRWRGGGGTPFRGTISVEDVLVSLHERDIETMLALQRVGAPNAASSV